MDHLDHVDHFNKFIKSLRERAYGPGASRPALRAPAVGGRFPASLGFQWFASLTGLRPNSERSPADPSEVPDTEL